MNRVLLAFALVAGAAICAATCASAATISPGARLADASHNAHDKTGSVILCTVVGPHVAAADLALAIASRAAVDAGTNDTEVLATTRARRGSAFVAVETDEKTIKQAFPSGMDAVTNGQIVLSQLSAPDEVSFATNSLAAYENALKMVDVFGKTSLLFERSVNSRNRSAALAAIAKGLAAMSSAYTTSNTTFNSACYGNNCYGTATTTTVNNSAASQTAAEAAAAVERQSSNVANLVPAMVDLTSKIDAFQYDYRRLRAVWNRACPTLSFPDNWSAPIANATPGGM